jgi:hypothetical protein
MHSIFEYLKKFPKIKRLGRKLITVKECYCRIIADDVFYRDYQKVYLDLPDCRDGNRALSDQYTIGNLRLINKPLKEHYEDMWSLITSEVTKKEGYTILRVGDGEANFLNGVIKGNTANRHFTNSTRPSQEYLNRFKEGLLRCDSTHIEMYNTVTKAFKRIYGKNVFSPIPLECIYALVASRKLFKNNYRIGIIGSDNKVAIIKELLKHEEYRNYIGRDSFEHFITVPERGSSNNVDELLTSITSQLDPTIDIYLIGIGIAKMAIMADFKKNSSSVFLDIGCGISALAGLVSNDRPYFADWTNFRLKNFSYKEVDTIDAVMGGGLIFL